MVSHQPPRQNLVLHIQARSARRTIIRKLSRREHDPSELASPVRMIFPAATEHVRVLERAKLARPRVVARPHLGRPHASPLKEAALWMEQLRRMWEFRFEALDALFEESKSEE